MVYKYDYPLKKKKKKYVIMGDLAAVISSQTVRQDKGETSGKQDAIMANSDQHKFFAFWRRTCPGLFWFSQSAIIPNSSVGAYRFSFEKEVLPSFSAVSKLDVELTFFLACILLRTVNICVLRRGLLNSSDAWNIANKVWQECKDEISGFFHSCNPVRWK